MKISFSWSCFILLFALLLPIDLPAGGSYKKENNINIGQSNFLYANDSCFLRTYPSFKSSNLRHIPLGTPLRLVRGWYSSDGELWLQVQINSIRLIETNPLPIRGWINA